MIEEKETKVYKTFDGKEFISKEDAKAHHTKLQEARIENMSFYKVWANKKTRYGSISYNDNEVIAIEVREDAFDVILMQYLYIRFGGFIKWNCNHAEQICWWNEVKLNDFLYPYRECLKQVFISSHKCPMEGWPAPISIESLIRK